MISVCIASYNGSAYLAQQLDSILPQLSVGDEVVISDDGSTDGTVELIQSYQSKNDKIKLYSGPHCGVVKNFENALAHAHGDTIFLSDQDDVWLEDKVARVLECMRNHRADLVVHNASMVDSILNPMGQDIFSWRGSRSGFWKNYLKNSFVGCCMAFDREVLDQTLPFPDEIAMHDWLIGLVASLGMKVEFLDEPLILYRRHESNTSGLSHKPLREMLNDRVKMAQALQRRKKRGDK